MLSVEGYVIVSANGMLADSTGEMPETLKFPEDQKFFESALDKSDLIVHGRRSHEKQPRSAERVRIILTRTIAALARDTELPHSTLWNPDGAPFDEACDYAGVRSGKVAVIGGPVVYALFLNRYDTFWLSQAHGITVTDGVGVFPGVPASTPQTILSRHGLQPSHVRVLSATNNLDLTAWRRRSG